MINVNADSPQEVRHFGVLSSRRLNTNGNSGFADPLNIDFVRIDF